MQYKATTPRYWVICICTRLHVFASLSGVFSLFSPLNIIYSFFLSACLSLLPPCCRVSSVPLCSLPPAPPAPAVSPSPWLVPCVCCVCAPEAPRRPSVCPVVFRAAVCPSLVCYQAQNAVTVGADAPRICPRPCLLLPMCCRVSRCSFRCPFRVLSCGFLPCVRVCVLPCVVRRQ